MTVVVRQLGGSMAVVIPKSVAREMNLREGTALEITAAGARIVLRRQGRRPRRPLARMLAKIDPAAYRRHARQLAADRPAGREGW